MFKKTLTAIIAATAIFGFNTSSFSQQAADHTEFFTCPFGYSTNIKIVYVYTVPQIECECIKDANYYPWSSYDYGERHTYDFLPH